MAQPVGWFHWIQVSLTLLAPMVTVIGGMIVYFGQKRYERKENLRLLRQGIYQQYLQDLAAAQSERAENAFADASAAMSHHEQLMLIAPDKVVEASLRFINVAMTTAFDLKPKRDERGLAHSNQPEAYRNAVSRYRDARQSLIHAMRRDLLDGTKIPLALPQLEDLK